jgi:hypothetical protein
MTLTRTLLTALAAAAALGLAPYAAQAEPLFDTLILGVGY